MRVKVNGFTSHADLVTVAVCVLGVFAPLTVNSPDEFNEGLQTKVTCTAAYSCAKHTPTVTWNRGGMPVSTDVLIMGKTLMKYVSRLTFTASAIDDGSDLTCTARYPTGQTQETSVRLRVKSEFDLFHFTQHNTVTWYRME